MNFQIGDRGNLLDGFNVRWGTVEKISFDGEVYFRLDDNGDAFWYPPGVISPANRLYEDKDAS
jgi:hypothetical protein